MRFGRLLGLLMLLVSLASCAPPDNSETMTASTTSPSEPPSATATPSQADLAPEDARGPVTFEAYEAAALAYRECMEAAGFHFAEFEYRPSSRLYEWLVNSDGSEPAAAGCYGAFEAYDAGWQREVAAQSSDGVREQLERCLNEAGIPFDEDASQGQLGVLLAENGINRFEC